MILDERLEFADALAIPTATGRALLGDVIDLGSIGRDIGAGDGLWLVIQITTAVTSAGAATVRFELVSDAQAAIAVDGTATLHAATGDLGKAVLVVGYNAYAGKVPRGAGAGYERYLGVITAPGVAALTAGAANAFLTNDYARFQAYANAY